MARNRYLLVRQEIITGVSLLGFLHEFINITLPRRVGELLMKWP